MKTTLNEIFKHDPCGQGSKSEGWGLLLKNLGKSKPDDEPLDLMEILESNGVDDATWALRCFKYRDCCLFLADIAESVLPIFEKQHPDDNRPRLAIKGIRDFHEKKITKDELNSLRIAVYSAAADAAITASDAAIAAYYAADNDRSASAYYVTCVSTGRQKREEVEKLFIKHFGDNE